MTDDLALLAAIRAAPDDDAPRLVYADWLDDHARPERAEFIRVQCALARRDDPGLRRREAELLAEHHDRLAGPFAATDIRYSFRRGFIVGFGHAGVYFSDGPVRISEAPTYACFRPDGTGAIAIISPPQTVGTIRSLLLHSVRASAGTTARTYTLDALTYPGALRIEQPGRPEYLRVGRLYGKTLSLDRFLTPDGSQPYKDYTLRPMPGFDTFDRAEGPEDIVLDGPEWDPTSDILGYR